VLLHTTSGGVTMHVRTPGSEREVAVDGGDPRAEEIGEMLRDLAAAHERRCSVSRASMVSPDLSPERPAPSGVMSQVRLCAGDGCLEALLDHVHLDVVGRPWPPESATAGVAGPCFVCRRAASQRLLVGRKAAGEK